MRSLNLTIALTALLPLAAHAQVTAPETVPREFMEMLWAMPGMMERPEAAVGRLPERLFNDLRAISEMRVVGSMISSMLTLSAIVLPGKTSAVKELVDTRLIAGGWKAHSAQSLPSGGFVTDDTPDETTGQLCGTDGSALVVMAGPHRADSVVVILMLTTGEFASACREPRPERPMPRAPVPALQPPQGVQHLGGGSGGGSMDSHANARMRTQMSPAALLAHYAQEMKAQGWELVAQSTADGVGINIFRMEAEGVPWRASLHVTATTNDTRELFLRVARNR